MKKNQTLLSLINNWLVSISPLFLLLLLQTLTGRYLDKVFWVWLWFCALILPTSILLVSRWKGPHLVYFAKGASYNTLKHVLRFYGVLLLVLLLILPLLPTTTNIITKINTSYLGLLPLQGVLLYLIYSKTRNPQTKEEMVAVQDAIQQKYASYDNMLDVHQLQEELKANAQEINQIFIAYDVADETWVERIQKHLSPLVRQGKIDLWDNTKLQVGETWEDAIEKAIMEAEIALLLISADFMASDFIDQKVLPLLLETARTQNTKIIPIFVRHTFFDNYFDLEKFYSLNHPAKPLASVSSSEQEKVLAALTYAIGKLKS